MTLLSRIEADYLVAYKAREEVRIAALRMLRAALKNRQVELRRPLTDGEVLDGIVKEIKQRQDSIEQFTAGGRKDLADREAQELGVLQAYLPAPITPEALHDLIEKAILTSGAAGLKDMSRVMQAIMAECKGRVDGKTVSELVRTRLSA